MLRSKKDSYDGVFAWKGGKQWTLGLYEEVTGRPVLVSVERVFSPTTLSRQLSEAGLAIERIAFQGGYCMVTTGEWTGPVRIIAAMFARALKCNYGVYNQRHIKWRVFFPHND